MEMDQFRYIKILRGSVEYNKKINYSSLNLNVIYVVLFHYSRSQVRILIPVPKNGLLSIANHS